MNSFTTNTAVPRSVLRQQFNLLRERLGCKSVKTQGGVGVAHKKDKAASEVTALGVLRTWWLQSAGRRAQSASQQKKAQPLSGFSMLAAQRASRVASKLKDKARRWEQLRYVSKTLFFFACRVVLPSRSRIRGRHAEFGADSLDRQSTAETVQRNAAAANVIWRFQRKIREAQLLRRRVRLKEFSAWHKDCEPPRRILSLISTLFLGVLAGFTMMICVLLSAAFSDEQCIRWVAAVAQSILMQIVVTAPLLGLLVFGVKMLISYILLSFNRAARVRRGLNE